MSRWQFEVWKLSKPEACFILCPKSFGNRHITHYSYAVLWPKQCAILCKTRLWTYISVNIHVFISRPPSRGRERSFREPLSVKYEKWIQLRFVWWYSFLQRCVNTHKSFEICLNIMVLVSITTNVRGKRRWVEFGFWFIYAFAYN